MGRPFLFRPLVQLMVSISGVVRICWPLVIQREEVTVAIRLGQKLARFAIDSTVD